MTSQEIGLVFDAEEQIDGVKGYHHHSDDNFGNASSLHVFGWSQLQAAYLPNRQDYEICHDKDEA